MQYSLTWKSDIMDIGTVPKRTGSFSPNMSTPTIPNKYMMSTKSRTMKDTLFTPYHTKKKKSIRYGCLLHQE